MSRHEEILHFYVTRAFIISVLQVRNISNVCSADHV